LTKTDRGSPTEKAGKSPQKQLVFMGYVHMKGKSKGVSLKLIGGLPRKRLENHEKATCVYEGEYVPMEEYSEGF